VVNKRQVDKFFPCAINSKRHCKFVPLPAFLKICVVDFRPIAVNVGYFSDCKAPLSLAAHPRKLARKPETRPPKRVFFQQQQKSCGEIVSIDEGMRID
jgi:hypothetical protein